jgi:hypothetical protein
VAAFGSQDSGDLAACAKRSIAAAPTASSIRSGCWSSRRCIGVAQIERAPGRLGAFVASGDLKREEPSARAALAQARQIGMAVACALAQVFVEDQFALDGVDVAIDANVLGGEFAGSRKVFFLRHGGRQGDGHEQTEAFSHFLTMPECS